MGMGVAWWWFGVRLTPVRWASAQGRTRLFQEPCQRTKARQIKDLPAVEGHLTATRTAKTAIFVSHDQPEQPLASDNAERHSSIHYRLAQHLDSLCLSGTPGIHTFNSCATLLLSMADLRHSAFNFSGAGRPHRSA
jgi:hypothetical protein